jgi:hypothetical protein
MAAFSTHLRTSCAHDPGRKILLKYQVPLSTYYLEFLSACHVLPKDPSLDSLLPLPLDNTALDI